MAFHGMDHGGECLGTGLLLKATMNGTSMAFPNGKRSEMG